MAPPPSTPATDAVASIEMRSLMSASSDLELDDDLSDFSPMSTSMSTPTKSHATPGVGTSSPRAVAVNMFISFVGAGILSLPAAFKISGWFLSTLCLTTVCALAIKCMLLLMEVRRRLEEQGHGAVNGYGDVGRILFGFYGEKLVDVCLVVSQMGFATAYIIFVSKNVFSLTKEKIPLSMTSFLCVPVSPPYTPMAPPPTLFTLVRFVHTCVRQILSYLVCLRSMKSLSPFSLVADCANILGLAIVFVQDVHFYPLDHDEIVAANWDQALYILSIAVYCFEGVGLILPLESSAADRAGFPKLLIKVISAITILMVVFGIAGYLGFGDATASPITDNMSGGSATVVKVSLCVGLYLTYPIMMFPVSTVLENAWLERKAGEGEGEYVQAWASKSGASVES